MKSLTLFICYFCIVFKMLILKNCESYSRMQSILENLIWNIESQRHSGEREVERKCERECLLLSNPTRWEPMRWNLIKTFLEHNIGRNSTSYTNSPPHRRLDSHLFFQCSCSSTSRIMIRMWVWFPGNTQINTDKMHSLNALCVAFEKKWMTKTLI